MRKREGVFKMGVEEFGCSLLLLWRYSKMRKEIYRHKRNNYLIL